MKYLAALLMLCAPAFADESKPLELPDTSKINTVPGKSGPKFEMSCKDSVGRQLKSGEAGYETCLANSTNDMSKRGTNSPNGGSTSVDVKFGK